MPAGGLGRSARHCLPRVEPGSAPSTGIPLARSLPPSGLFFAAGAARCAGRHSRAYTRGLLSTGERDLVVACRPPAVQACRLPPAARGPTRAPTRAASFDQVASTWLLRVGRLPCRRVARPPLRGAPLARLHGYRCLDRGMGLVVGDLEILVTVFVQRRRPALDHEPRQRHAVRARAVSRPARDGSDKGGNRRPSTRNRRRRDRFAARPDASAAHTTRC